jgi:hypothetical protein
VANTAWTNTVVRVPTPRTTVATLLALVAATTFIACSATNPAANPATNPTANPTTHGGTGTAGGFRTQRFGSSGHDSVFRLAADNTTVAAVGIVGHLDDGGNMSPGRHHAVWDAALWIFEPDGTVRAERTISGPGADLLSDIVLTGNGAIIATGAHSDRFELDDISVDRLPDDTDGVIISTDRDGRAQWVRTVSGAGPGSVNRVGNQPGRTLVSTKYHDGPLRTTVYGPDGAGNLHNLDGPGLHLLELDDDGALVRTDNLALDGEIYRIAPGPDGGWYLAGEFNGSFEKAGVDAGDDTAGFVISLDADLQTRWVTTFESETDAKAVNFTVDDRDGTLWVVGHFRERVDVGQFTLLAPGVERNGFLVHLDADGTPREVSHLHADVYASPHAVLVHDGDVAVIGEFKGRMSVKSDRGDVIATPVDARGEDDGFVARFSTNVQIWATGAEGSDKFFTAAVSNGQLVLGGGVEGPAPATRGEDLGDRDAWLWGAGNGHRPGWNSRVGADEAQFGCGVWREAWDRPMIRSMRSRAVSSTSSPAATRAHRSARAAATALTVPTMVNATPVSNANQNNDWPPARSNDHPDDPTDSKLARVAARVDQAYK